MVHLVLEVKGLNVWFKKDRSIISNLDLVIPNNTIIGLVGKNGSGKTTLIKSLSSVFDKRNYQVTSISLNGESQPLNSNVYKLNTYTVFTENNSFLNWNFSQYFNFVCRLFHVKRDDDLYDYLVKGFNFGKFLQTSIGNLSTGNKKKVFLITGFYLKRPLLILDEPFDGLDFDSTEFLYEVLVQYRSYGSILMTSHIAESIARVCDEAYFLEDGHLKLLQSDLDDWLNEVSSQRRE